MADDVDGIDELEGNHLAAAVAREVMGEAPPDYATELEDGSYFLDTDYSVFPWRSDYWPNEYAKDERWSFKVVDRMRSRIGPTGFQLYGVTDGGYECRMGVGSIAATRGFGKTPAEAICRAALRAVRAGKAKGEVSQ